MMTVIWTFIKNPKNLIIVILAVLFVLCMGIVLYQRASLATKTAKVEAQATEIERYKATQKAYQGLIDDYAGQIIKLREVVKAHQTITNNTAKEVVKIKYVKSNCKLEGEDVRIVNGIAEYFNSGGMRDN